MRDVDVLILGAGVSGIAAAAGCLRAGIDEIVVVDRAAAVGGTWLHNVYPGCAVDIPTHVYSFSWAPNPEWSRVFAPQAEIRDYLEQVVSDFAVRPKLQLNTEILEVRWDEPSQRWLVETTGGLYRAKAFVSAAGPLHEPIIPRLPGLDSFQGERFHSSAWPQDLDLTGKRVVVVGTGASAVQFVPAIQPQVASVTVLQRTPSWVVPKADWPISETQKDLLRRYPFLMKVARIAMWAFMDGFFLIATRHPRAARGLAPIAKWHMRRSIDDPGTVEALTPDYAPTCKRLGLSNDFYRAFGQPNVQLVTSPAAEIRAHSVVTADGREIAADVLIFGTGFHTLQTHPANRRITGRGGRTLEECWDGNPTAYMGTTVTGFPNAFFMFGPNIGTLSGFVMAEAQTDYLVGALKAMRRNGLGVIDVRPEAQRDFVQRCDRRLRKSTFLRGGCSSYYLSQDGSRVSLAWPWSMTSLRRRLARFDLAPYDTEPAVAASAAAHPGPPDGAMAGWEH